MTSTSLARLDKRIGGCHFTFTTDRMTISTDRAPTLTLTGQRIRDAVRITLPGGGIEVIAGDEKAIARAAVRLAVEYGCGVRMEVNVCSNKNKEDVNEF